MSKHIVIIGGVAGGASAAARLRRLSEDARITIIERGKYVSFANCGLPYHIGKEIERRDALLVHTAESLGKRFNITVRTETTAIKIHAAEQSVEVESPDKSIESIRYDELILATGAAPLQPPLPGLQGAGAFVLRDIADMDAIISWLKEQPIKRAVVVGGGFIGVEVAEQLVGQVPSVSLVEGSGHVIPPLDPEMAEPLNQELRTKMDLVLNSRLTAIERTDSGAISAVTLSDGRSLPADIVILGLGVRPDIGLAKAAGLAIGETGGLYVNEFLQTSDPHIWAIGDAIEVTHSVTGKPALIALAGPANRQGRLVADNILLPEKKNYRGTLGTAIVRVFSKVAACTGINEKIAVSNSIRYEKIYLAPASHAGYFPGAHPITMKVLFDPVDRTILGAQAVGEDGVDKRIDILATAIKGGLTIDEVADLELCYAPPFGSAKDPVNMVGMMAQNIADGLVSVVSPDALQGFILDVRTSKEFENGSIPGAVHIPLDELRERLSELPHDTTISVYCHSGQRSYNATRILTQAGFTAYNVTGAYKMYQQFSAVAAR